MEKRGQIIVLCCLVLLLSFAYSDNNMDRIEKGAGLFTVPFYPSRLNKNLAEKFTSHFHVEITNSSFFTSMLSEQVEKEAVNRILGEEIEQLKTWRYNNRFFDFLKKVEVDYAIGGKLSQSGGYLLWEVRLMRVQSRQIILEKTYFYEDYQQLYQQGPKEFLDDILSQNKEVKSRFFGFSLSGAKIYGNNKQELLAGGELSLSGSMGQIGFEIGTIIGNKPSQYFLNYRTPSWHGLYFLFGSNYFNFRGKKFSLRYFKNISEPEDITYIEYIGGARSGLGYKIDIGKLFLRPELVVDGIYAKWKNTKVEQTGVIYTFTPKISLGFKIYY